MRASYSCLVKKLKAARVRRRAEDGKCEGRKSFAEMARARLKDGDSTLADMIAMAKRLHRANPKTGNRLSLRRIAAALAKAGHVNVNGREFNPASIKAWWKGRCQRSVGRIEMRAMRAGSPSPGGVCLTWSTPFTIGVNSSLKQFMCILRRARARVRLY
jgi:hypothetical protein